MVWEIEITAIESEYVSINFFDKKNGVQINLDFRFKDLIALEEQVQVGIDALIVTKKKAKEAQPT